MMITISMLTNRDDNDNENDTDNDNDKYYISINLLTNARLRRGTHAAIYIQRIHKGRESFKHSRGKQNSKLNDTNNNNINNNNNKNNICNNNDTLIMHACMRVCLCVLLERMPVKFANIISSNNGSANNNNNNNDTYK